MRDSVVDQFLSLGDLGSSWFVVVVVSDEHDSKSFAVPVGSMGTDETETTTFIDVTISTDSKVVANISPAQVVHVIGLHVPHLLFAGIHGAAVSSSGVVDDNVSQVLVGSGLAFWSLSTPLGLGDDGDTIDLTDAFKEKDVKDLLEQEMLEKLTESCDEGEDE